MQFEPVVTERRVEGIGPYDDHCGRVADHGCGHAFDAGSGRHHRAAHPSAPIELPFSAGAVTAAESPDGAVFVSPQNPTSPAPTVTWVIDGNGPAEVAEHIPAGVAALAADANNFYVATYSNVFSFDRASGNANGQWNMPSIKQTNASDNDLVSLAAAGGSVFVTVAQVNTVLIYRIVPPPPPRPT